jgi:nucleotide-binding universal stress UspA family protein
MFKKILVPYDGSEPADRSLNQAVGIAKLSKDKPEVILLHVIAEFPAYHIVERPARSIKTGEKTSLTHYLKEVYELMEKNAADALAEKKDEMKKLDDFEIKTKVLVGNIADEIIDFTNKELVDLIVIGNVGRSGMSKIRTLGSISRSVSERAHCPVMIVH